MSEHETPDSSCIGDIEPTLTDEQDEDEAAIIDTPKREVEEEGSPEKSTASAISLGDKLQSASDRGKLVASKGFKGPMNVAKKIAKVTSSTVKEGGHAIKKVAASTAKQGGNVLKSLAEQEKKVANNLSSTFTSRDGDGDGDLAPAIRQNTEPSLQGNLEAHMDAKDIRGIPATIPESPKKSISTSTKMDLPEKKDVSNLESAIIDDHMIIWIVVASIALVQTMENWRAIQGNTLPLSVALAWMLVAFTAGMEVDGNMLTEEVKTKVLGLEPSRKAEAASTPVPRSMGEEEHMLVAEPQKPRPNFFGRVFRRSQKSIVKISNINQLTVLRRSKGQKKREEHALKFDKNLVRRLSRFGRKPAVATTREQAVSSSMPPTIHETSEGMPSVGGHTIGATDLSGATADQLKIDIEPLCQLRGLDIFLTDYAEQQMTSHPFLLKNGLREVPTLVVNLMTQWGTVLTYFEMPSWVKDTSASLVEKESDEDDVKALKRFLNSDDAYRKARLKLMPELVEAPYPVRLMAPKGKELVVHRPGLIDTIYYAHDVAGDLCPTWEVTLDLMGTPAIRGMATIVKRYLKSMSVDFAAIISKPEGQKEDEPEACLGLWRMNHLDLAQAADLPDRFAAEGCCDETIHAIRASILIESANEASSKCITVTS